VSPPRSSSVLAAVIVASATLVMLAWSVVVPVYEAPDEPHHWRVARYLHDHRSLPRYDATLVEANQPPIYYVLIAPLARSDAAPAQAVWADEAGRLVVPFSPRLFLNTSDAWFQYRGLRAARALTVLMSAAGLVFAYLAALEATGRPGAALFALVFVAFLPQFTFRAGTISNDTLVMTFGALTTWLTVRLVRRPYSTTTALCASAALAAAYLTKISAICLAPPLAAAMVWTGAGWRGRARQAAPLVLAVALVAPWSVRNVQLYGDVFASGAMRTAVANIFDRKPITSPYFRTTFPTLLWHSFVGVFGWLNVYLPRWVYWIYGLLVAAAVAGLGWRRSPDAGTRRAAILLAATFVLNLAVVVHINLSFSQPQGRYLFPALAALGGIVAMGLAALPWGRAAPALGVCGAAGLLAVNAYALAGVELPAYYPPVMPAASETAFDLPQPRGVQIVDRDGWLHVAGDDPQLIITSTFSACDIAFLRFDLEGRAAQGPVRGSVYFSRSDAPMDERQRVDFEWIPDGRRRTVTVAVASNPRWRGRITAVRIDPVNGPGARRIDLSFRIGSVRASGRL
jgi:hypothetical protein